MKLTTKTEHTITFKVKAFWDEEGGMGTADFGGTCSDLPTAVNLLMVARAHDPKTEWVITADVATITT